MRTFIDMMLADGGGNRVAFFFFAACAVGMIVKVLVR